MSHYVLVQRPSKKGVYVRCKSLDQGLTVVGDEAKTAPVGTRITLFEKKPRLQADLLAIWHVQRDGVRRYRPNASGTGWSSDWLAEREAREAMAEKLDRKHNEEVAEKVRSWFSQIGRPLDLGLDRVIGHSSRRGKSTVKADGAFTLSHDGLLVVQVAVDMNDGAVVPHSVRAVWVGRALPLDAQTRVRAATGKTIKYHKSTNAWVYDSDIDGRIQEGDGKLLSIAKKLSVI